MRRTLTWIITALALASLATAAGAGNTTSTVQNPIESGRVEQVNKAIRYPDGQDMITFKYPGAEYMKVHIANLILLPGDYLTISNADGTEETRVTRTGWAMSITGDTAKVLLHKTTLLSQTVADLGVTIDQVARGFTGPERQQKSQASRAAKKNPEESVCGGNDQLNAVCYKSSNPAIYKRTKAVARLLIRGVELCTAWRVGPNNRMLTNHHCITDAADADDTEVWFNYQCAECNGYAVFKPTKVWLGQMIKTDKTLDYTLFAVDDFAKIQKFGYLDLDLGPHSAGEELYIPQHPSGAPAMVAMSSDQDRAGLCAIQSTTFDGYATGTDVSYYCDTEGGSSGSPVLSRNTDKVVALHHFGGCPNSGVRIDLVYDQIKSLL